MKFCSYLIIVIGLLSRPAPLDHRQPALEKGRRARQVPWPPVTGDEQHPGRRRDGRLSGEGPARWGRRGVGLNTQTDPRSSRQYRDLNRGNG